MANTILIIDDDEFFVEVTQQILEEAGYNVISSNDSFEAMSVIGKQANDISVVILDWQMPNMTGLEFLKWVRNRPEFENIQVIMQTSMDKTENIKEGIDAGAFYYLTKPTKKEIILSTVQSAVKEHERKLELLTSLKESQNSFRLLQHGILKYQTVKEGDFIAVRIANCCPKPESAMFVSELLCNAVEHGNLGITYDEKTAFIEAGILQQEIDRRLLLPEYKNKFATVTITKDENKMSVLVEDEGNGFDFEKYLLIDDKRIFDNHGRGIAIAASYIKIKYLEKGNKVSVEFKLK